MCIYSSMCTLSLQTLQFRRPWLELQQQTTVHRKVNTTTWENENNNMLVRIECFRFAGFTSTFFWGYPKHSLYHHGRKYNARFDTNMKTDGSFHLRPECTPFTHRTDHDLPHSAQSRSSRYDNIFRAVMRRYCARSVSCRSHQTNTIDLVLPIPLVLFFGGRYYSINQD